MTQVINEAFEPDDEKVTTVQNPKNYQVIPYLDQIETASVCSESVTLPSEYVAKRIEYKKQQRAQAFETEEFERNNNVQYNIRLDKVVIVGGDKNRDVDIEEPMSHAVNEILSNRINYDRIPKEYIPMDETRLQKLRRLINKRKVSIPIIIILLALIGGLSYTTYHFITHSIALNSKTMSEYKHKLVKREDWKGDDDSSLQLNGKFKIIAPVNRIILLKTQTDMCASEEQCMSFMLEHQQNAYPEYDDIRENFIIAQDGTVFEGRGFEWEGEASCENDMITCYNNDAISIAFVQNFSQSDGINEKQHSGLCEFIGNYTEEERRRIDESFNVFNHDNLISSATFDSNDYNCLSLYKNVPEIEERSVMIDNDLIDDGLMRQFSKKVMVTSTNSPFCGSKENCKEVIQKLNQSSANFIIGGEKNTIFADNNFDLAVSESLYDTLVVLFIGNYATNQPTRSLITDVFSMFLEYAVVLEKLSRDYKICVTNEATQLTNEIQRINRPDRYENFCNS